MRSRCKRRCDPSTLLGTCCVHAPVVSECSAPQRCWRCFKPRRTAVEAACSTERARHQIFRRVRCRQRQRAQRRTSRQSPRCKPWSYDESNCCRSTTSRCCWFGWSSSFRTSRGMHSASTRSAWCSRRLGPARCPSSYKAGLPHVHRSFAQSRAQRRTSLPPRLNANCTVQGVASSLSATGGMVSAKARLSYAANTAASLASAPRSSAGCAASSCWSESAGLQPLVKLYAQPAAFVSSNSALYFAFQAPTAA